LENRPLDHERRSRKRSGRESDFFGARLRVARTANEYTQTMLGEMVHAGGAAISKLETGRMEPSDGLLRALCEVLDVDASYFARPVSEEYALHECSFRHLQSTSRKLLEEVLARGSLQHEAIRALAELVEFPAINIPEIPARTPEEIERAAAMAREAWGVGDDTPILNVVRLAEHAGAVVTRLRGTTEKVDAFSRFGNPPTILLTSVKGSTSKDRFNVAHELGHLVIHRGQITGDTRTEHEANRFADALLLPAQGFSVDFRRLSVIDWPNLFELKRRWGVAGSRILRRAEELWLVSAVDARRLYKQHSWRGWHKGEPYEPPEETPELLDEALDVAKSDWQKDLSVIALELGWGSNMTEIITGKFMPRSHRVPDFANVASITAYTKKGKARR